MLHLFVLMYADDTVIMAENEHDMQRNLNLLNDYCNCNKLKVNISKTKIMVFARSKTRLNNIPTFKYGNIDLEQVDDYIYLGICFNWNGSFVKAKKLLHDKASKAMYSLIQKGRRLNLPTDIMLKLFDSCVEPILLYGCEVWGYENVDILEKVHTKFCKFIFGVSKYSHNMPVYGKLSIKIKQRMVRYWSRILKSSEYKLNKVMHTILYNLHCKNVHLSPWIRYVSSIFQNCGINYVWLTQYYNIDTKIIFKSECDQFKQLWHGRIINKDNDHNVTYSLFYIVTWKGNVYRNSPGTFKTALFQFRRGTYILPVHNRKQLDVSRSERICRICDEGVIGDEIHFLFECPKLEDLRIKCMALGDRMIPNVYNFVHMLQDDHPDTIYSLAKFAFHGLKLYVRCSP